MEERTRITAGGLGVLVPSIPLLSFLASEALDIWLLMGRSFNLDMLVLIDDTYGVTDPSMAIALLQVIEAKIGGPRL